MNEPILLFLDIDGVIHVRDGDNPPEQISRDETGYPVPGAKEFLKIIDNCSWIHPMWISSWGLQSQEWNKWAKTRLWPVAYPFEKVEKEKALKLFPDASDKYLAARWHSRDWQHRIVWVEDGLRITRKAVNWAQSNPNIHIIDTLPTMKESCQGYKTGIKYWNIEQICNVLNIQENREILFNHIKYPFTDFIDISSKNQDFVLNEVNSSTKKAGELLQQKVVVNENGEKQHDSMSFISKIRNLFKLSNLT